ncbi:LOW QUALITY PROTEIN: protein MGARP [Malurus melanocephalus]|uniref:LOW QUALITY PROTEIN: protein MGARP n=1 Tax=Malurus melanocephalus TaxID=175006 RepID=UPI00254845A2|nr:LOW QUALITY PROTEIN: protein MGARP [Malurus melanocephalus]
MSLCRAASQALASRLSRAPAAASRLKQRAPPRQMSSGSVPGSSGDNMMIYLLAGVAAFGGLFYAYRVVNSSRTKFIEHTNILRERAEGRKSNSWSRKEGDEETDEVTEAEKKSEEADAAAAVEPAAQDESAGPTAQDESSGPTAQDESSGVSPEAREEKDLLAPEASHAVEEAQQEAAANSEAAAVQETVSEVLDVAASAHEKNLDSDKEGVASAAQEISEPASKSQDTDAEESWQTPEGARVQLGLKFVSEKCWWCEEKYRAYNMNKACSALMQLLTMSYCY